MVPYLNPYQMNEISIDPKGTAADVELDNTSQKVAPYSGAVVKLKYNTKQGTAILVNATYQGNRYRSAPISLIAKATVWVLWGKVGKCMLV